MTTRDDVLAAIDSYVASEVAPYNSKIVELTDKYAELQELNSATEAENQTLYARIRELEAELNPAPAFTVRGCSRPDNTYGANGYQLGHEVAGYRTYLSPSQTPSLVSGDSGLKRAANWLYNGSASVLWLSVKARPAAWLDSLMTDVEFVFPNERLLITCYHEPFNLFEQGAVGIAQFHEYNDRLEEIVANHSRWEMHTIFEGYRDESVNPGYWEAMYRSNQTPSWDRYNLPIDAPKSYRPPEELFANMLQFSADHGCDRPSIAELGSAKVASDTTGSGRLQWIKDNHVYVEGVFDTVLWFNQNAHQLSVTEMDAFLIDAAS